MTTHERRAPATFRENFRKISISSPPRLRRPGIRLPVLARCSPRLRPGIPFFCRLLFLRLDARIMFRSSATTLMRSVHRIIARLRRRRRLLSLRLIQVGRFAGPSLVGQSSQLLHLSLADKIVLLFFNRGGILAHVSEPLVPLRWRQRIQLVSILRLFRLIWECSTPTAHLDISEVGFRVDFHDASVSRGVQCILELPVRVSA